jgi:ribonucleoside-diphosphate reductase alpha chain
MQTGCGPLYVTVNEDKNGLFELFTTMGKAGGCAASQSEAIGRMVSLAWRSGVQARQVVKQLLGISCHCPSGFGENRVLSCADAVGQGHSGPYDRQRLRHGRRQPPRERGACPECGGIVEHEGGCIPSATSAATQNVSVQQTMVARSKYGIDHECFTRRQEGGRA